MITYLLSPAHARALAGKPAIKPPTPEVIKFTKDAAKKRKTG
jgi:hypothetical protein